MNNPGKRQHGGRRPGAGAPRGNLNAYKHGGYSRQASALRAVAQLAPDIDALIAKDARRSRADLEKYALALRYFAELLLVAARAGDANKKKGHLQIHSGNILEVLIKHSSASGVTGTDMQRLAARLGPPAPASSSPLDILLRAAQDT
jgi:hypothetical protein